MITEKEVRLFGIKMSFDPSQPKSYSPLVAVVADSFPEVSIKRHFHFILIGIVKQIDIDQTVTDDLQNTTIAPTQFN